VDVSRDHPVAADFHFRVPRDFDVLADFGDERPPRSASKSGFAFGRKSFRHFVAKRAESFVARHKIRLAVDLHEHAEFAAGRMYCAMAPSFASRDAFLAVAAPFLRKMSTASSSRPSLRSTPFYNPSCPRRSFRAACQRLRQ
jgi:hypothetical protein